MNRIDLTGDSRGVARTAAAWTLGWLAYIILESLVVHAQSNVYIVYALLSVAVDHLPLALMCIPAWYANIAMVRRHWSLPRILATHFLLGIVAVALTKSISAWFFYAKAGPAIFEAVMGNTWMYQVITTVFKYATLIGIIVMLQNARRQREIAALTAEAEVAAARAQLHPHFLVNSLNSILSLIDGNPRAAREMVVRLSELLQASLRRIDERLVPLDDELAMIQAYLDIERVRFGSRLAVAIDASEAARRVEVPPLVLQPLVENAVRHGIAPHARDGTVALHASLNGGRRLHIDLRDSGDGATDDALNEGGLGIALTRRRLDSVYGSDYTLAFDRGAGGFTVRIDLPVSVDG